jgi:hypothetical protein
MHCVCKWLEYLQKEKEFNDKNIATGGGIKHYVEFVRDAAKARSGLLL